MRTILRNFLSVIRRFKVAVVLNVLGLSVAFAAFMVIMIQLKYDYGFDKFHKDHDRIFRVEFFVENKGNAQVVISRPLAERFFESSPHILAGAIANPWMGDFFFHTEKAGQRNYFEESLIAVSPEFTDVFTFDFTEGRDDALKTPENAIIPLSLARKIFGKESAIGKQLAGQSKTYTIGAVFRDFPANTVVNNCIYVPLPDEENKQSWGNWNYNAYIRVNDPSNAPMLFDNFKWNFDATAATASGFTFTWDETGDILRLTALPDIHFVKDVTYDSTPKSSRQTLLILLTIGLVTIAIAGINFTNFSTALTPMRIKNINTQRVLGARRSTLRLVIVSEAVIISFVSYLLALLLVILFNRSPLARLVDADLSVATNPLIIAGTALIALITGLFSGLYPSRYMTSYAPALVLKGSFGLSPKGKQIRSTLISIQFIASFTLMIGASFMYLQNRFMQNSPLGYDKDALLITNIGHIQNNREAFTNQLQSYSGIEDVTYGESLLSSSDRYMGWGRKYNDRDIVFQCLPVHYTFLKVMGIDITDGRDFRREDAGTQNGVYVFNETARNQYELELGTSIEGSGEIIGFMSDIKFASFRTAVIPMAFYVWGTENWGSQPNQAYIRVKAGTDLRAVMSFIQSTLAGFAPEYTFNVRFFDDVLQRLYEKEIALSALISLFSLLAIFISIVGVFGLVVFDSECRRKEIGIRKVLGASVMGIIVMFNRAYIRILLICFAIAAPTAWYTVHRWLENFAYKTPMYWWVYLLALATLGIITAATVTFQNWRVANDNPVKAIKTE